MSDWSTRSVEFWQESSAPGAIRFRSTFTLAICICNRVMFLLLFGYITRLILLNYSTLLQNKISTIWLFSHAVFSLCPVYTVFLHYCNLHYLFLAIACLKNLNFIYEEILRLNNFIQHLTQISAYQPAYPVQMACSGFWVG